MARSKLLSLRHRYDTSSVVISGDAAGPLNIQITDGYNVYLYVIMPGEGGMAIELLTNEERANYLCGMEL